MVKEEFCSIQIIQWIFLLLQKKRDTRYLGMLKKMAPRDSTDIIALKTHFHIEFICYFNAKSCVICH